MHRLSHLQIPHSHIAIFGSGHSVNSIGAQEFATIKANTFLVTLNYAPIHLHGHLNMWSDRKVSQFLEQHYTQKQKDCLLLAQEGRVSPVFQKKVDYWFDRRKESLQGNYTIVWALQLFKKYFPEKAILLFGIDMYATDNNSAKWYDRYTDYDRLKRGKRYRPADKLNQCAIQFAKFTDKENVYNCNLESRLNYFEKKNWQDLL